MVGMKKKKSIEQCMYNTIIEHKSIVKAQKRTNYIVHYS